MDPLKTYSRLNSTNLNCSSDNTQACASSTSGSTKLSPRDAALYLKDFALILKRLENKVAAIRINHSMNFKEYSKIIEEKRVCNHVFERISKYFVAPDIGSFQGSLNVPLESESNFEYTKFCMDFRTLAKKHAHLMSQVDILLEEYKNIQPKPMYSLNSDDTAKREDQINKKSTADQVLLLNNDELNMDFTYFSDKRIHNDRRSLNDRKLPSDKKAQSDKRSFLGDPTDYSSTANALPALIVQGQHTEGIQYLRESGPFGGSNFSMESAEPLCIPMDGNDLLLCYERQSQLRELEQVEKCIVALNDIQQQMASYISSTDEVLCTAQKDTEMAAMHTAQGTVELAKVSKTHSKWWFLQGGGAGIVTGALVGGCAAGPVGLAAGAVAGAVAGVTSGTALTVQHNKRIDKIQRNANRRVEKAKSKQTIPSISECENIQASTDVSHSKMTQSNKYRKPEGR